MNARVIVNKLLENADLDDPSAYIGRLQSRYEAIKDWCHFYHPKIHWGIQGMHGGVYVLTLLEQPMGNGMARKLVKKLTDAGLITDQDQSWHWSGVRVDITFPAGQMEQPVFGDSE